MTINHGLLLKIAAVLWVCWGLVHIFAGLVTISQDAAGSLAGIADAVDLALIAGDFHPAVGAVLNQNGFNLLSIAAFTVVGRVSIWKQSVVTIFMTAIVGWITDIGYFIFMDIGGFVKFVLDMVMTIVSTAVVVLSPWVYYFSVRGEHSSAARP